MKIVNLDLWLGMSSASNGARSFARIMLDFTITAVKKFTIQTEDLCEPGG